MKQQILLILLLMISVTVPAQTGETVNEGDLYVSPGTVMTVMSNFSNKATGQYENNGEVLFRGNFNNDGITTFNPAYQGYTRFEGAFNAQDFTGSIPADFYDVLFHNPNPQPAFRLFGDISISGNADFLQGIVQADGTDGSGGFITFESEATHTNVGNESHVDGHVIRNGRNGFVYPIGDNEFYRYAAISSTGEDESSFIGRYYYENSDTPEHPHANKTGVITEINNQEYWTIDKVEGETDVLITLSWDTNTTTPSHIVAQPYEEIHIVRWDEAQHLWVDEGGVADPDSKTITTFATVKGYGIFTLARVKANIILPGDIVIYQGVTPNGDGENDYFIIDKLKDFPNNTVEIYNRWGVKVYETKAYDTNGNVFSGFSEGRATITGTKLLPSGTYFYIIEYEYEKPGIPKRTIRETGYLYLSADE